MNLFNIIAALLKLICMGLTGYTSSVTKGLWDQEV